MFYLTANCFFISESFPFYRRYNISASHTSSLRKPLRLNFADTNETIWHSMQSPCFSKLLTIFVSFKVTLNSALPLSLQIAPLAYLKHTFQAPSLNPPENPFTLPSPPAPPPPRRYSPSHVESAARLQLGRPP